MNIIALLADLLGSKTISLAVRLIPLLGRAFDKSHADEWIYDKIDDRFKNSTFDEFKDVLSTGKAFMTACYKFLHK